MNMMPPRPYQPQSPVVVSSHPVNRGYTPTPPIVHSHTPPVPRINSPPQFVPSTPSPASFSTTAGNAAVFTPQTEMTPTPTPPPFVPAPQPSTHHDLEPNADVKGEAEPERKKITLPWLSVPDQPFPARRAQKKKKKRAPVAASEEGVAFPVYDQGTAEEAKAEVTVKPQEVNNQAEGTSERIQKQAKADSVVSESRESKPSTVVSTIELPPSETGSSKAPTPTTAAPSARGTQSTHKRNATIPAVPLVPLRPAVPSSVTSNTQKSVKSPTVKEGPKTAVAETPATAEKPADEAAETNGAVSSEVPAEDPPKPQSPVKAAPKSWAELLRAKAAPAAAPAASTSNGVTTTNAPAVPKSNSLPDALATFSVLSDKKVSFLEPRGLVNSGNLCYMNSILQVLLFCIPFYDFLDQVNKRAVHNFKSETPLIDAMIMFMRDFKIIDSAETPEKLCMRLKDTELEQYGDPLAPEYVYDVIRRLPRFENMKRGQQEDAEEFLGFLLAGLHDECAHVIKSARSSAPADSTTSPKTEHSGSVDNGWLEVGPKQKASVTQSSGIVDVESPVTKIFGGKLRSEYKKPGEKPSVTLEPYQPLQLDIGSPEVHNIADALRGLTHLETLDSPTRGGKASTKQVFIDTLPPVLILHLKRFHYDANGPAKIWKKVGYPLELEIPKEVFPPHARGGFGVRGGLPRYRLTGVVYHHGKNASGGHYTVDLRRQDGKEWIRMDDTVIRRIRSEDVAEGGSEEDPKVLAAALEQHNKDAGSGKTRNFYDLGDDEEKKDEGGWSKVNGADKKDSKKWSGVVNGTATPASGGKRTPLKESVRDNKVAYILFYQRVEA